MKKTGLLLMMLLVASVASAQDKMFSYGLKAGLNLSSYVGGDVENAKMKPCFHAGIVTEFRLGNVIAISPELLYSAQGTKLNQNVEGETMKATLKYNYLTLPVLAKFYVTKGLSIDFGPQVGYRLGTKLKAGDVTIDGDALNELMDFKDIDLSLGLGATYNFGKVFAQARYNYGLTDVAADLKARNSVAQISVGYKF